MTCELPGAGEPGTSPARDETRVVELWTPSGAYEVTGGGCEPTTFRRHGEVLADLPADLQHMLQQGLLCNDAQLLPARGQWSLSGNPVDVALVVAAVRAGMVAVTEHLASARLDMLPPSPETRVMATLHRSREGRDFLVIRGAPEVVLSRCQTPEGWPPLDNAEVLVQARAMAARGLRVLSLADRSWDSERTTLTADDLASDCTFTGLVGLLVPDSEILPVVRVSLPA